MRAFAATACLVMTFWLAAEAHGRPSMGRAGGGGHPGGGHHGAPVARPAPHARPQMPQARPAMPQARPAMPQARPNVGGMQRPQTPQFQRPSVGSLQQPNLARPSFPNAGAVTRPAAPAASARPGLGAVRPAPGGAAGGLSRPPFGGSGSASLPGGGFATRPTPGLRPGGGQASAGGLPIGGGNRPGVSTLPGAAGGIPGMSTRPTPGLRPGLGATTKPFPAPGAGSGLNGGNRPGMGGNRPGLGGNGGGGLAGGNRPTTLPGVIGGGDRPGAGGNRPGLGGNRPTPLPGDLGTANRPGLGGNRPDIGGNRPGIGGNRPGIGGNRPGIGGNRPGLGGNRPTTLPEDLGGLAAGNRPGGGYNRPDGGWNRPGLGGNRPGIGGNNNFWNSGNININNGINTGWGGGWNGGAWGYPGWGGGSGWNHGYVNPHYGSWYNGGWNNGGWNNGWGGFWGGFATGAATWGLASAVTNWGLGYGTLGYAGGAYVNPYYSAIPATVVAASPYDYSQPIVVNNYIPVDGNATGGAVAESTPAAASDATVDAALEKFKSGDYTGALAGFDAALKVAPNDSVIHEVRALTLFALGRYPESAAALNAVLAAAPGMDWTTVSNLYPSVEVYTAQLRKLEDFCRANPGDAAAHFVLAYQYLVGGHSDAAASALEVVVAKQPGDIVAKRLLGALKPAAEATSPEAAPAAPPAEKPAAPETDLVGTWKAGSGADAITLEITAESKFTWKAAPPGKPAVDLAGTIETAADAIALHSEKAGTMVGKVASKGPDAFEFSLPGAPAEAKPLLFQRQR